MPNYDRADHVPKDDEPPRVRPNDDAIDCSDDCSESQSLSLDFSTRSRNVDQPGAQDSMSTRDQSSTRRNNWTSGGQLESSKALESRASFECWMLWHDSEGDAVKLQHGNRHVKLKSLSDWSQGLKKLCGGDKCGEEILVKVVLNAEHNVPTFAFKAPEDPNLRVKLLLLPDSMQGFRSASEISFDGFNIEARDGRWLADHQTVSLLSFKDCHIPNLRLNPKVEYEKVEFTSTSMNEFPTELFSSNASLKSLTMRSCEIEEPIRLKRKEAEHLESISSVTLDQKEIDNSHSNTSDCQSKVDIHKIPVCITDDPVYAKLLNNSRNDSRSDMQEPHGDSPMSLEASQLGDSGSSPGNVEAKESNSSSTVTILASTLSIVGAVLLIIAAFIIYRRRKFKSRLEEGCTNESVLGTNKSGRGASFYSSRNSKLLSSYTSVLLNGYELKPGVVTLDKTLGHKNLWLGSYNDQRMVVLVIIEKHWKGAEKQKVDALSSLVPLRHENIVAFHGYCFDSTDRLLVAVEYMCRGSLQMLLKTTETEISWIQRQQMIEDICVALLFLRSRETTVYFQTLTSKSVLCTDDFRCKLDILDLQRKLRGDERPTLMFGNGRVVYEAPEVLAGGERTSASEVYSFGILMCEIACRGDVFDNAFSGQGNTLRELELAQEIMSGSMQPVLPADNVSFRTAAIHCLSFDASKRLSLTQILELLQSAEEEL